MFVNVYPGAKMYFHPYILYNPRISPWGAYTWGGLYKISVDIKKTLLKDLVYFSRNFFTSI